MTSGAVSRYQLWWLVEIFFSRIRLDLSLVKLQEGKFLFFESDFDWGHVLASINVPCHLAPLYGAVSSGPCAQ